jgi:TatD DNase family protein
VQFGSRKLFPAFRAVGWHLAMPAKPPEDLRPALRDLARHPKVVALGETGLDYYHLPGKEREQSRRRRATQTKQSAIFRQQLEVAADLGLNCVIHQRAALEDVLSQMQPFASRVRGVFHCFVDDATAMQRIVAMGSLVSFTGIATFKNAQNIRDVVAVTPLDQ